jgi:hypothetical protein
MIELAPCPGCKRHVAIAESACPFCGAASLRLSPVRRLLAGRLPRAAVFASATLVACGPKTSDPPMRHDLVNAAPRDAVGSNDLGDADEHHFAQPPIDASVAVVPADAPFRDPVMPACQLPAAFDSTDPRPLCQAPADRGVNRNHRCTSPKPGQKPVCMPYGAPPARRRVV